MTRIGVGGLINLDRIHQAQFLLNDIRLFHQHADSVDAASVSMATEAGTKQAPGDEQWSRDVTPDTAEQ